MSKGGIVVAERPRVRPTGAKPLRFLGLRRICRDWSGSLQSLFFPPYGLESHIRPQFEF